ncbi:unnamed protein product [Cyprideis torosa]|uniref:Large ribosomal subunit protein eL38 n=1 Tax=Cyprideis torosa TaxID=163714 RepID=A0A7R8W634_9CRUS|nr:unnamed protein product [Cyprideis torosa]CAG0885960.1 unnamed protein product [Cyprideis torosa]
MASLEIITRVDPKQGTLRACRYNVDGGYCLSVGADKTVQLWNPVTSTLIKTYAGHDASDSKGSCDNSQIVTGGLDKQVFLWDVETGQVVRKWRDHFAAVNSVAFNEEGTVSVSGSTDGSVRLWDGRSKKKDPIQVLEDPRDSVSSVCVSSHEIMAASLDGHVYIWDIRNGSLSEDFVGVPLTYASFTWDSMCFLVSCQDSSVKLFDKGKGDMLAEYIGHRHEEFRVESCLSKCGNFVLSGSEDSHVYLWGLLEADLQAKLPLPFRVSSSLSPHPKENSFLVAAGDAFFLVKLVTLNNDSTEVLPGEQTFLVFPVVCTDLLLIMPKEIKEIKDFLLTARRKDAKSVMIKKNPKDTKFKVRCSRYLYTLVVQDREKAEKLKQSLPPGLLVKELK